jgi:hypothetical protein
MVEYSNFSGVMEARDHFKNEASSKILTSKGYNENKLKVLFVLVFIMFSLCMSAQNEEISTLFSGNRKYHTDYYVAFGTKFSQMDNGLGLHLGGKMGVVFNNTFSIGGAGYGLLPTAKITFDCPIPGHETEKSNNYWSGGYGGLFFEYINSSNKLLHFTANALIGCSRVTYKNINNFFDNQNNHFANKKDFEHPSSFVFILEPGVAVELNMTKIFKMSLGVSYRYVPNFKLMYEDELVPSTFFDGISANLVFKFGLF